jgi:hypothetical protein
LQTEVVTLKEQLAAKDRDLGEYPLLLNAKKKSLRSMPCINDTFAFLCRFTYTAALKKQAGQNVSAFNELADSVSRSSILDYIRYGGMIRMGFAEHQPGHVEATPVVGQQEGRLSSQEHGDKLEPDCIACEREEKTMVTHVKNDRRRGCRYSSLATSCYLE